MHSVLDIACNFVCKDYEAVSLSRILRSRELTQFLLKLKTETLQNFKSLLWNGQNEAYDNCSTSSVSTYMTFANMYEVQID